MERLRLHLAENHPSLTLWVGVACYPAHALTAGEPIRLRHRPHCGPRRHQSRIEVATDE